MCASWPPDDRFMRTTNESSRRPRKAKQAHNRASLSIRISFIKPKQLLCRISESAVRMLTSNFRNDQPECMRALAEQGEEFFRAECPHGSERIAGRGPWDRM